MKFVMYEITLYLKTPQFQSSNKINISAVNNKNFQITSSLRKETCASCATDLRYEILRYEICATKIALRICATKFAQLALRNLRKSMKNL